MAHQFLDMYQQRRSIVSGSILTLLEDPMVAGTVIVIQKIDPRLIDPDILW
jgi:hypothetical protein